MSILACVILALILAAFFVVFQAAWARHAASGFGGGRQRVRISKAGGVGFDGQPYADDIERVTVENRAWRRVLHTTPQQQLVVMSVPPLQDIPMERHAATTQLIRVESGTGTAVIGGRSYPLHDNSLVVVPPNTQHRIINDSAQAPLQVYTVYSPPEHAPDTLQERRSDDPGIRT